MVKSAYFKFADKVDEVTRQEDQIVRKLYEQKRHHEIAYPLGS